MIASKGEGYRYVRSYRVRGSSPGWRVALFEVQGGKVRRVGTLKGGESHSSDYYRPAIREFFGMERAAANA